MARSVAYLGPDRAELAPRRRGTRAAAQSLRVVGRRGLSRAWHRVARGRRRCDRPERRGQADLRGLCSLCRSAETRCRRRGARAGRGRRRGEDPERRQRAHHPPRLHRDRHSDPWRADRPRRLPPERGGAASEGYVGQPVLPGHAATERAHPACAEARRPSCGLSRRRHQRRLGLAWGRRRHLGRQRRRRGQGGRRSRAARARSWRRA